MSCEAVRRRRRTRMYRPRGGPTTRTASPRIARTENFRTAGRTETGCLRRVRRVSAIARPLPERCRIPYRKGGAGTGREGRTGAPSDAAAEAAERGSPPRGERRRPGYSRLRIRIHAEGGHRSEHCTQPHRARAHAVPEGGVRGIGPRGAESSLRTPIVSCVQVLRAAGARGANRSRRLRATRSRRRSRGPCGCCSRA